ncbi:hypothetical protein M0805_001791 [Coniferiporia weirii]|nr:hypothetical protein M0805_001791 [Coniferiporia weirii]
MLGLDYGSDSDEEHTVSQASTLTPAKAVPNAAAGRSESSVKPKLALNPPASASSSKGLSLPPPKAKKSSGPKKILVELPKLDNHASDDDELADDMPAAKKPRLGGRGGASALLSMLPVPKKSTMDLPAPQRVLGGGRPGLVFSAALQRDSRALEEPAVEELQADVEDEQNESAPAPVGRETTTSMIPPSMLLKGKLKVPASSAPKSFATSVSEPTPAPAIDFFSLGSASSSRASAAPSIPSAAPSVPPLSISTSISAAPKIEEYTPPSPKTNDPYPGYYQLPSGTWAMHDPAHYKTYSDRWAREYEAQIRAYEKGQKGFEGAGADGEDAVEVTAAGLADAARAAREEKKSLTRGARLEGERAMPKIAINPTKTGGLARTRHQLHSLLTEAYMNREALEDKIAQGKRNRKEAGNKYGF